MSTRPARTVEARLPTRAMAALLAGLLALALTAAARSSSSEHHLAHAKAVFGPSNRHSPPALTAPDQHAVADRAPAERTTQAGSAARAEPVALFDLHRADPVRVRGPPGRIA